MKSLPSYAHYQNKAAAIVGEVGVVVSETASGEPMLINCVHPKADGFGEWPYRYEFQEAFEKAANKLGFVKSSKDKCGWKKCK